MLNHNNSQTKDLKFKETISTVTSHVDKNVTAIIREKTF